MVTLLNSLFFVFKILLLPNYHVNYYDFIVKWCSGIACNWCVLLDFGLILASRSAACWAYRAVASKSSMTFIRTAAH